MFREEGFYHINQLLLDILKNTIKGVLTATADVDRHGATPTYRKPLQPGARRPLGRGHGHMSVQQGARWQPCPAYFPSIPLTHRALPPPGTGKARHL